MFDMSWGEVLVIGAVALIVIGPKELPRALRTVGQMTSKIRRMASEFQTQFNDAMREAELDDVKKDLQGMSSQVSNFNPIQTVRDELRTAIDSKPDDSGAAPSIASPPTGDAPSVSSALEPELPLSTPEPSPPATVEALAPAPVADPPSADRPARSAGA